MRGHLLLTNCIEDEVTRPAIEQALKEGNLLWLNLADTGPDTIALLPATPPLYVGEAVNGDNHPTNGRPIGANRDTGLGPNYASFDLPARLGRDRSACRPIPGGSQTGCCGWDGDKRFDSGLVLFFIDPT